MQKRKYIGGLIPMLQCKSLEIGEEKMIDPKYIKQQLLELQRNAQMMIQLQRNEEGTNDQPVKPQRRPKPWHCILIVIQM